jgi:predicted GIY-YIG superfamily endonuclease
MKQPCVYIMASRRNGTLYTGVTSNLPKRAFEHREGLVAGFSRNAGANFWFGTNFTTA